ncbi:Cytochrome b-c1 complex subunit Rieske mitochondrial [Fasciola gigantica]|uniref:Cytochrome b-c1 complex subunit Rieske, mitochondrial n=1 Tax=Fasciola gigantica TaxID=46835 RepID=A0A504X064_FASGI|nr:Cytochrome b-c1 complex subunit Rieske mitochondrial [Fasciola gigantica]
MALPRSVLLGIEAAAVARTVPLAGEKCTVQAAMSRRKTPVHWPFSKCMGEPKSNILGSSVSCGLGVSIQVRVVHTDVANVPDFTAYRVDSTKSPTSRNADSDVQRKIFGYTMMFAGAVMATTAAKYTVKTFITPLGPTAKTLAEASTEVNLSTIPEGKNVVVKWRNKPLFVRHRTAEEISRERAVPLSSLRDPERDEDRVQHEKWLICLGVCTHLGCVPIALSGDYPGGFYCPCHGSHYDASGRIRKGPAPLNLEVPEYRFIDENNVIVG